jgi:steroid delta-isomerase-like uncharacterized protein
LTSTGSTPRLRLAAIKEVAMSDTNRETIRRFFAEAFNEGRLDLLDEFVTENAVFETPFGRFSGPSGVRDLIGGMRAGFSDLHAEVEEVVGERDRLVARVAVTGTNDGDLMGMPATGRNAAWPVAHFIEFRDGKYHHDQVFVDRMGLMEQLGHVPQPA